MNEDLPKEEKEFEEPDLLSEIQKKLLCKSLEQADAGLGTPLKEINQRLRAKYGLEG